MTRIQRLQRKSSRLVIGMISGTSADGIDTALVKIKGNGVTSQIRVLAFDTYQYPRKLQKLILANSLPGTGTVDLLCTLNVLCAHFFADAARRIARKAGTSLAQIDLIGSHGQTVHHLPTPLHMFGKTVTSTMQLGNPSIIAKMTGIPTIGDFRSADMALKGQGAPLAPYLDFVRFRSIKTNRILLNLGGIANFTVLPKKCSMQDVIAFDTGPANMLIDGLMVSLYRRSFDRNGSTAAKGAILPRLLSWMMSHPYFRQRPPKSTGRELFGKPFVDEIVRRRGGASNEDLIRTATEFTALSVFDQYRRFIHRRTVVQELIVSGGGVHNRYLMNRLAHHFRHAVVEPVERFGLSSDEKEAVLFALLANETIAEIPSNVPRATGAIGPTVIGNICL